MKLALNLTYPHQRGLMVEPKVGGIRIVDGCRAIRFCGLVIINNAFGKDNIVPDVDRYRIHLDADRIMLHPYSQCHVAPCSNRYNDVAAAGLPEDCNKTIVIVLESPHKDEYLCNVGQPIAPAQGSTGSNIQGWLDHVLRSCPALCRELRTGTTRVMLSNPVQFQASLASVINSGSQNRKVRDAVRKKIRDAVWKALWDSQPTVTSQDCGERTANASFPIRDCFEDRLKTYNPDYIINACTSTGSMKKMKESVSSFLRCRFLDCKRYEVNHPSCWHMKENNRKLSPMS